MADHTPTSAAELQTALTASVGGDRILLDPTLTYEGVFTCPAKGSTVTLTSNSRLPDRRLTPADAALLATLRSGTTEPALSFTGSANWVVDGVAFERNQGGGGDAVIAIEGSDAITLRRVVLDVPASTTLGQKRFVRGNGTNITLRQSYCAGVWYPGEDSQCFVAWDGAGPYTIQDCYLEGASENILFGGADSASEGNIPADILIEQCYLTKPLRWDSDDAAWQVKNLLELKAALRVIIRNNIFERTWAGAQDGHAILFTPRNQDGGANWSRVYDVLFARNIVRSAPVALKISGYDDTNPSRQTSLIHISHNLFLTERLGTFLDEIGTLTLDHNTYQSPQNSGAMVQLALGDTIKIDGEGTRAPLVSVETLTITNSILSHNEYGVHGDSLGTAGLELRTTDYTWNQNVLVGGPGGITYPAVTYFISQDEYSQHLGTDYLLVAGSVFEDAGVDGADLGWGGQTVVPTPEVPPVEDPDPFPDPEPNPEEPPDPGEPEVPDDEDPTPDPDPDPIPDVEEPPVVPVPVPVATVTINAAGRSGNFKVRVVPENPGVVSKVEFYVDQVLRLTLEQPTSGSTYQAVLSLSGGAPSLEVKVYGR
jgi:hypothetical protein